MKKIMTAVGDKFINENLSKENNIEIIGNDFLYQEAIFEIIENNEIDFLIINENIFLNYDIIKIINKIILINKKINIIIIINKNKNIINKIKNNKNIYIILNNNYKKEKINQEKILSIIKNIIKNENKENYFEIEKNKNQNKIWYIKILDKIQIKNFFGVHFIKRIRNKKGFLNKEIITVIGEQNIGKSTISFLLANKLNKKKDSNILIIDLNIFNQSLYSKFNQKKYSNKIYQRLTKNNYNKDRPIYANRKNNLAKEKIKNYYSEKTKNIFNDFLIKINNNTFLISGIDLILKNNKKINNYFLLNEIKNLNNIYKKIIIDTGTKNDKKLNNDLLKISTKILLVVEPEISKIVNAKNIIERIKVKNEDIENKIIIVVNKRNKKSVYLPVIKKVFKGMKIIKIK